MPNLLQQYALCMIDPAGKRTETRTGPKDWIEDQAWRLNRFAAFIDAGTRWETYPLQAQKKESQPMPKEINNPVLSKDNVRAAYEAASVFAPSYHPAPEVVAAILLINQLGPKLDRIADVLDSSNVKSSFKVKGS
jgi:hypothetical protein